MLFILKALAIGFASGFLSGQFGIGGGLVGTPGLRIVLRTSAGIALGTTLPVIIPTALSGLVNYSRNKLVDWRLAGYLAPSGLVGAVSGAWLTAYVSTDFLLLLTAFLIFALALPYLRPPTTRRTFWRTKNEPLLALLIGFGAGFFAGLLGIGGGFLLIPALTGPFNRPIKRAFGTSLATIIAFAVPGSLVHYYLGHIDPILMMLLAAGSIPGAFLGSKTSIAMNELTLRRLFGAFLIAIALYFGVYETRVLLGGGK